MNEWNSSRRQYRAALYIRLSREDGDKEESDSVSNQKELLKEYLMKNNGIFLKDFYIDDGYTGTNFERPAFRRMIGDVLAGIVNCVIVKDLSRFGRDYIDTGYYLERLFPEKDVRFISLLDGIDSEEKSYDLLLPIKNVFNEQYARDISRKIRATMKTKQKAGDFIGAFACYGYKKHPENKNRLVVDEEAADVVRRIFSMFVQGVSKQKIAEILNKEMVPCPSEYKKIHGENYKNANDTGNLYWTYSTIRQILRNEIYTGKMVQGKKRQGMRGSQRAVPQEEWIRVEGTHEPVISKEVWAKAQRLLRMNQRNCIQRHDKNTFSGLIKCGDCKSNMLLNRWKRADGSWNAVYYCGTYKRKGRSCCTPHALPASVIESAVEADLNAVLEKAEQFQSRIKELLWQEENANDRVVREILRSENKLNYIRKRIQSLYEDYSDRILSKEEFLSLRTGLRGKEEMHFRRIQELKKEKEEREKKREMEADEIIRSLKTGKSQKLDRNLVLDMIDRIEVYEKGYIKIYYRFAEEKSISFAEQLWNIDESGNRRGKQ